MVYKNRKLNKKSRYRKIKMGALSVLVILIVLLLLVLTKKIDVFNTKTVAPNSAGQETKGEPKTNSNSPEAKQTVPSSANTSKVQSTKNNSNASTFLKVPLGTYVSSHNLGINEGPLESTCVTTPGATCTIKFSKNSVVKSLQIKTTDTEGVAYWTWYPKDINLSTGSWKIQAVATLNGQTKTSSDALTLNIGN